MKRLAVALLVFGIGSTFITWRTGTAIAAAPEARPVPAKASLLAGVNDEGLDGSLGRSAAGLGGQVHTDQFPQQ